MAFKRKGGASLKPVSPKVEKPKRGSKSKDSSLLNSLQVV